MKTESGGTFSEIRTKEIMEAVKEGRELSEQDYCEGMLSGWPSCLEKKAAGYRWKEGRYVYDPMPKGAGKSAKVLGL